MNEYIGYSAPDITPTPEVPTHTETVRLPQVQVANSRLSIAMHTDTIGDIIKAFRDPLFSQIQIEGRVLTPEQKETLLEDPIYKLFMDGRLARSDTSNAYAFLIARDIELPMSAIKRLITMPFTPRHLARKIGYTMGYYSGEAIRQQPDNSAVTKQLLVAIGGCTEFTIGSSTLSSSQVAEAKDKIETEFKRELVVPIFSPFRQQFIDTYYKRLRV